MQAYDEDICSINNRRLTLCHCGKVAVVVLYVSLLFLEAKSEAKKGAAQGSRSRRAGESGERKREREREKQS